MVGVVVVVVVVVTNVVVVMGISDTGVISSGCGRSNGGVYGGWG